MTFLSLDDFEATSRDGHDVKKLEDDPSSPTRQISGDEHIDKAEDVKPVGQVGRILKRCQACAFRVIRRDSHKPLCVNSDKGSCCAERETRSGFSSCCPKGVLCVLNIYSERWRALAEENSKHTLNSNKI